MAVSRSVDLEKLYSRTIDVNDNTELTLYQSEIGDVGCVVWDAALVLSKYLQTQDFDKGEKLKGKTVLELGAGTGVVGLVAAALGAHSVITDLPQFVPLMQHNISANAKVLSGTCQATTLTWGNDLEIQSVVKQVACSEMIDYVLVADCVYYEESIEPLVETIKSVSCPRTIIFCCYEDRDLGNKTVMQNTFFKMAQNFFDVSEIPQSSQDVQYRSPDIHIMKMMPKQEPAS